MCTLKPSRTTSRPSGVAVCFFQRTAYVDLFWQLERHLLQPAAGLVGRLPPGQPLRAHRCRRPVLRLQRPQDGRHQVRREQHALDQLVGQRLVGGHALLGDGLQRGAVRAQPRGQVCEHVVRELAQPQAQPAGRHDGVRSEAGRAPRQVRARAAAFSPDRRRGGWLPALRHTDRQTDASCSRRVLLADPHRL